MANYVFEDTTFPEPPSDDEIMEASLSCDHVSCLHNAAKYERLEDRARACGLNELAVEYENAKEIWYWLYYMDDNGWPK